MRQLFLLFFIVGCAPGKKVFLENGELGFEVKCKIDKSVCHRRAGEACKGGYKVVRDFDSETEKASLGIGGGIASARYNKRTNYSMIVECTDEVAH